MGLCLGHCEVLSPSSQLEWSPGWCCILGPLGIRLPVGPPLTLWLPVLGFSTLNEWPCFLKTEEKCVCGRKEKTPLGFA